MVRSVEPEDAAAFWEARYEKGLLYGTEPTSVAHRLGSLFRREKVVRLLEAGCGSGRDALFYAREGFAVTGLDLSANALRWAQEQAHRDDCQPPSSPATSWRPTAKANDLEEPRAYSTSSSPSRSRDWS